MNGLATSIVVGLTLGVLGAMWVKFERWRADVKRELEDRHEGREQ